MKAGSGSPCGHARTSLVVPLLGISKVDILPFVRVGHPPTFALAEAGKLSEVIEAAVDVKVVNGPVLHH